MNRRICKLLGILLACAITFAPHVSRAAPYAPLDCKKAATPVEKTVCGNYGLGQDEAGRPPVQERHCGGSVAVFSNIIYIMYDNRWTHSSVRRPGKMC